MSPIIVVSDAAAAEERQADIDTRNAAWIAVAGVSTLVVLIFVMVLVQA
jgi:hypothetical protein